MCLDAVVKLWEVCTWFPKEFHCGMQFLHKKGIRWAEEWLGGTR